MRQPPHPVPMITLTTDFGDEAYVGAMRGAILSIEPEARLVDITHGVPKHDVQSGAFSLYAAVPYFPEGTIHVAVIDPGVGTERKGIAIQAGGHMLIGPDNGLLLPAARRLGIRSVHELAEPAYFLEQVSRTFHARDIFGPVAAHVAKGVDPQDLGPEMSIVDLEDLGFGEPFIKEGIWTTEVVHVDGFGNATTNLPGSSVLDEVDFGATAVLEIFGERIESTVHATYGDGPGGHPFVTIGSAGLAELAMREESFAQAHGVSAGDEIKVQFLPRTDPVEELGAGEG